MDTTYSGSIDVKKQSKKGCTLQRFTQIMREIWDQPGWREQADKESDYIDGNQLDGDALKAQEEKGVPPSIENLMGIQILTAHGRASSNQKDAKVIVQEEGQGEDVAAALNAKINKYERSSNADKACLLSHLSQIGLGLGWVEVSRQTDLFKPPYRCLSVNRNEIWWDMTAKELDLSDALWLLRRKWVHYEVAALMFPKHKDVIEQSTTGWMLPDYDFEFVDGGSSTGLAQSREVERGWSVEEQEWKDDDNHRVCIYEVLTRHYRDMLVIKAADGRIIEFNKKDPVHVQAIAAGYPLEKTRTSDIWKTYFVGPHEVGKEKLDTQNGKFNYVPFFYHREDRTGVPYGMARGMMYLQDEYNARTSSMVWGLGSVRTVRTEGAVNMTDEDFRQSIARRDSDIILNKDEMRDGGIFEVERDYNLTEQQYKRMQDLEAGVQRQSMMTDSYRGGGTQAADTASGLKMEIEQGNQATSSLNENYEYARTQVLNLLLDMIIADTTEEEDIYVSGNLVKDDRVVTINKPVIDEQTGQEYKENDVQRIRTQVALAEVASNPSLAQQELMSLTEFAKASMPEIQAVLAPHIANLSSIPHKEEIVQAIREIIKAPSQEDTDAQIEAAIEETKVKFQHDLKSRELDLKAEKNAAEIQKLVADAVNASLTAFYSATQAATQVAAAPALVPIADQMLDSVGFEDQSNPVDNSIFPAQIPQPAPQATQQAQAQVVQNTSPQSPPRPQQPPGIGTGIETPGAV